MGVAAVLDGGDVDLGLRTEPDIDIDATDDDLNREAPNDDKIAPPTSDGPLSVQSLT